MYQPTFGTKQQISFRSESEYYELLGYLSKNSSLTNLVWERNDEQGAWGQEGRIEFYEMPTSSLRAFLLHTAGTGGSVISRVNCNEFLENLSVNHNFVLGKIQDQNEIKKTIPASFIQDFESGLSL